MPNSLITRSQSEKKSKQGNSSSENPDNACESESAVVESKMAEVTLNLHPEMIKALIPVYDGKSMTVETFLARVEQYAVIYGWKDEQKFLYASTRLEGVPRLWYNSISISINSWAQFSCQIKAKFNKELDAIDVHFILMNVRKMASESYIEFSYRVNELAANNNVAEPSAVKYIIAALGNDSIYAGIVNTRFSTLDELTSHFQYCEMMSAMNDFKKKSKLHSSHSSFKSEPSGFSSLRCFKCNEQGHKKVDCHSSPNVVIKKEEPIKVRVTCTYCKFTGHTEDRCFKKKKDKEFEVGVVEDYGVVEGYKKNDGVVEDYGVVEGYKKKKDGVVEDHLNENMGVTATIIIQKKAVQVQALFDTGSSVSMINEIYLPPGILVEKCLKNLKGINGAQIHVNGMVKAQVIINNNLLDIELVVVREGTFNHQVLIGRDFVDVNDLGLVVVDRNSNIVISSKEVEKLVFDLVEMNEVYNGVEESVLEVYERERVVADVLDVGDTEETKVLQEVVTELFDKNYRSRQKPDFPIVKQEVIINLKGSKIFHTTPMRYSMPEKVELNKIIEDLMKKEVIRESNSEYSSRVVLVRKKNGSYRMCINYKELNKMVERNHFPLPVIEDIIVKLKSMKYFSSLDLKNGFYHVDIAECSRKYTAFVSEEGQFEFNKLPFGFANSPSEFARYVSKVLVNLIRTKKVVVYMDDILVGTETIQEHLELLKEVFITLSDNHVQLQMQKCCFVKTTVEYLGYKLSQDQIMPSEKHIDAVKQYPVPMNQKSLQRFLGFISYFRKFIIGFNKQASCLYDLMKRVEDYKFTRVHLAAFNSLKEALISKPILGIYSPTAETQLHTDASARGYGAILMQKQENEKLFKPIMYFSRKSTEAEAKMHSFELETLAVVYAVQRFRIYLFGIHFTVITDCSALKQTMEKKDVHARIARWALILNEFDFDMIHRKGDQMQHVDALSRMNVYMVEEDEYDAFHNDIYVNQLRDENIQKTVSSVRNGRNKDYQMRDTILYKKDKNKLLLVVPENMIVSVIYKFHDEFGHFGVDKVEELIKRSFYFSEMRKRLIVHIKNCVVCIRYTPKQKKYDGMLNLYEKGKIPFYTIHIDHLVALVKTKAKNENILAVVDGFTKFIRLFPTRTTNTAEVLKSLEVYFRDYSIPTRIVSDRGTAFTSKAFKEFVDSKNIKHVLNATASPKSNGQVERYNRTLVPVLSKLVDVRKKDWDVLLPEVEHLLNNSWNRSVKEIPSKLLFGVVQKREIDENVLAFVDEVNAETEERNLINIREKAYKNIMNAQEYNKRIHDQHCKSNTVYNENDLVMIRNVPTAGMSAKLEPKFKGPYRIKRVLNNNRYVIEDVPGFQVSSVRFEGVFDPLNMRKYKAEMIGKDVNESEEEYLDYEYLDSDEEI